MPKKKALQLKVKGLDRFKERLEKVRKFDPMEALEERAATTLALMQAVAPKQSGELAGDLAMVRGDNVIVLFSPTWYAHFPEFGTQHTRAQPFFYNTFEEQLPEFRGDLQKGFRRTFK